MRIGIDCRTILNPGYGENAGVGHYTYFLVKNLISLDKKNKYILFFDNLLSKSAAEEVISGAANAEIRFFPFHKYKHYLPVAFSHILVSAALEKEKLDVFHSPAYVLPLSYKGKSVVTVHDLAIYKHPEWFPSKFLIGQKFSTKTLVPKSLGKAAKIIAVSEHTRKDIAEIFKIKKDKVEVVYEGVETRKIPSRRQSVCGLETEVCYDDIKIKYGLKNNYALFLGTIEPRKNLLSLLRAFSELLEKDAVFKESHQFIIAGAKGWKNEKIFSEIKTLAKKTGSAENIKYIGYVSDQDKFALIKYASCFVFPSLYEGFGLPVLEALSLGTPTITSNISSMPEVAGDAAILVNPESQREISEALKKVLSDGDLRAELSRRGREQAKKFSWEKSARETLAVYEKAAK